VVNPPPPGPPWDAPVEHAPFAFVDLEMTGLDATQDRVVEICVERIVGGQRAAFLQTLVDPGERMGGAAHVHGLDSAQLSGAPDFRSVARDVVAALEGAIFVAHGAKWDVRFLLAECGRSGVELRLEHWLDTLVLARRAFAFHAYSLAPSAPSSRSSAGKPIVPRATSARRVPSSTAALRSSPQ
jgi:DNA polymerase-3 subunit epsilon